MKLMFNMSTVGVYTAVVSATTMFPMVHVHAGPIQDVFDIHLHHNANSSSESKSVSTSFIGRELRRELQPISEECQDITEAQLLEDLVYIETEDANTFACPDSQQGWLTADAGFISVIDYRNCDQSQFRAYCQANYQVIDLPDHFLTCPQQEGLPFQQIDIYRYDAFVCLARDLSCTSDSDVLTEQDINDSIGLINCTVEFLEEGHQPPQKPPGDIESDNLSEECLDEIAMIFDDDEFQNAFDTYDEVISETDCELSVGPYFVGNDTFLVFNSSACGELLDYNGFFDAVDAVSDAQLFDFTNRKVICPGNLFFYLYSIYEYTGKSCPSDQGDYTGNDMQFIFLGFENCVIETLEEGDEPPSPLTDAPTPVPSTTEDPPTEAPVDNGKGSKGNKAYSKSTKAHNGKGSKA